jgi:hypothetical protein
MSPELQEFYNSYQAWLDDDAPMSLASFGSFVRTIEDAPAHEKPTYHRSYGLCYALHVFTMHKYQSLTAANIHRKRLFDEMVEQFVRELRRDDGYPELTMLYPFGSPKEYRDQEVNETAYLNPQRIAWVKKHATNTKEAEA